MKYFDNKWISWYIENPLKEYKEIKKYFKPLTKQIYFGKWNVGFPLSKDNCAKILNITCFSVTWKDKYNSPRHEHDPQLTIVFFRKWCFHIRWWYREEYQRKGREDCSMEYWETALDWLYYGKTLSEAMFDNTGWGYYVGDKFEKYQYSFLQEPYQSKYDEFEQMNIKYEQGN
jgi:hypothetical protein